MVKKSVVANEYEIIDHKEGLASLINDYWNYDFQHQEQI